MRISIKLLFWLIFIIVNVSLTQENSIGWQNDLFGYNASHYSALFLKLPSSAGAMGMNAIAAPAMMDATDLPDATAASAFALKNQIAVTHLDLPLYLKSDYIGAAIPFVNYGAAGVFAQAFYAGSAPQPYTSDGTVSTLSLFDYRAGLSFARPFLHRKLAVGVAASYVEYRSGAERGRTIAGAADVAVSPWSAFRSELYCRNFGTNISTPGPHPLPLTGGVKVAVAPWQSADPARGIIDRLTIAAGIRKTDGQPVALGLGLCCEPENGFIIRSGYDYNHGSALSLRGLCGGVGFQSGMVGIDAGWRCQSPELGSIWALTVKCDFPDFAARSEFSYVALARECLERKRFLDCIAYAKKAIDRNPNLAEAHDLLDNGYTGAEHPGKPLPALISPGRVKPSEPADRMSDSIGKTKTPRIAFPFLSRRLGGVDLFMKTDDQRLDFPLTQGLAGITFAAISREAARVAFSYRENKLGSRPLVVIDFSGAHSHALLQGGTVREARFSPDGAWLYVTAATGNDTTTDIYRCEPDSGAVQPVVCWKNSTERDFAFSPDGSEIAFCSDRDRWQQIYLTRCNGGHPLRLTDISADHRLPRYSPNGALIAYLSNRADPQGTFDLWLYDRTANTHRRITHHSLCGSYCWLDDSRTIIFCSGLDLPELCRIDIATDSVSKFIKNPPAGLSSSEVSPRLITANGARKLYYTRELYNGERHIFRVDTDGSNDEQVIKGDGDDWLGE
jgi:Tol biopolymer transport system component